MARLRHVVVFALVGLGACAGQQLRREPVGHWAAAVALRGGAAGSPAPSVQLSRGRYELALHLDVPRAQVVEYVVACTSAGGEPIELTGQVGETFDAYRTRRLAELNRQQDRDRAAAASAARTVTSFVPGAQVSVGTQATSPAGTATATSTVSTESVRYGATVSAEQAFPPITELLPGDVGATRLEARQQLMLPADATCVVRATAEDATVIAAYDVTRVRDLGAEARERQIAAVATAHNVRVQLKAQLEARGADPLALEHRREAEEKARAERLARLDLEIARRQAAEDARRAQLQATADAERARRQAIEDARGAQLQAAADAERERRDREMALREEQRRRVELELHLQIEARLKIALEVRTALVAYLAGTCNADPNRFARLRAERELKLRMEMEARLRLEARLRFEREQREARLRAEREAREARLRAELEARAAADNQRIEIAMGVRGQLQAYLVSIGARQRPPMPALVAENPGSAPFDGARWSQGHWVWSSASWSWTWIAGGWTDATVFGDAGGSGVTVVREVTVEVPAIEVRTPSVGGSISVGGGGVSIGGGSSSTGTIRDHRTPPPAPTSPAPVVRDHRTLPATNPAPVVRDRRTTPPPPPPSTKKATVRDHRTP